MNVITVANMADNYDYLSYPIHESIYPSNQSKDIASKGGTDIDSHTSALNFFRCLEGINKFVCHCESDVSHDMLVCSGCSDQLLRMIERAYKSSQEQARSYSVTIHEYQTEHPDYVRMQDSIEPTTEKDVHNTLLSQQSDECELDLLSHIKDIEQQRTQTMADVEAELILSASLECEITDLDAEIEAAVIHSDRAGREINLLNAEHGSLSVLFDLSVSSKSLPGSQISALTETNEITSVINGMRLMYLPSHSDNLNWAEINRAWSCLSLLVCCLRNRAGLQEKAVIVIEVDYSALSNYVMKVDDVVRTQISLQLRPLRRRTLILLSVDQHRYQCQEPVSNTDILFLCGDGNIEGHITKCKEIVRDDTAGDGGDEEVDDFSDTYLDVHTEQHRRYQYFEAVIALAAYICATARDLDRLSCLTEPLHSLDLSPLVELGVRGGDCQRSRGDAVGDLVGQMCLSMKNLISDI